MEIIILFILLFVGVFLFSALVEGEFDIALMDFIATMILCAPFFFLGMNGWHKDTGRGEHTGYVTAVEKEGVFWKTGRAYIKTDNSSSQENDYCVIDEGIYQKLQELARTKQPVTITHQSWFISGWKSCNNEGAIIIGV